MSDSTTPIPTANSDATTSTGVISVVGGDNPDVWRNRRRMAYISLFSNIFFVMLAFVGVTPIFGFIPIDKFRIFVDLVQVYLVTSSSVIAAYIGFTTWSYSRGVKAP